MELLLLLKITVTIGLLGFVSIFIRMFDILILKPERLRSKLRKQGISGPPPSFLFGNIRDMKNAMSRVSKAQQEEQTITHNCSSKVFPSFEQWRKEYGSIFMFSLGNIQILHIGHPDVVKEISVCTSLDFGRPSYLKKEFGRLLGQGLVTSNGAKWAHQRKILAPELYMEKVKGMMNLIVEASITIVNALSNKIETEGGVADIKVDEYMKSFSGDVIARACFGSNYAGGEKIFMKLKALKDILAEKKLPSGIPGMRYLPTKSNREAWRLEKEVDELILNVVKERKEATPESDLLQMVLDSAIKSDLGQAAINQFIVDNCKNIYLAAYEATAAAATWTMMLLASNPEWQAKVRAEVLEVCGGQLPDDDMIRNMKTLNMVIHESLRLYPTGVLVSREAFHDMKFGGIHVPKGVIVWSLMVTLHQDPEIWGPDADKFNPERFANGVSGACKLPHVYTPFGVGPRKCLGQYFAMVELKIILSLIVSSFSFSLSPKYRHSPTLRLAIEPEYGVDLLIRKL